MTTETATLRIEPEAIRPKPDEIGFRPGDTLSGFLEMIAPHWGCSRSQAAKELALLAAFGIGIRYRRLIAAKARAAAPLRDSFGLVCARSASSSTTTGNRA